MDGGKYHFQAAHQFFLRKKEELTRIRTEQRGFKEKLWCCVGPGGVVLQCKCHLKLSFRALAHRQSE